MKRKLWIALVLATLLVLLCYASALADQNGTCGANLTWTLNESTGVLTISGTGSMYNYYISSSGCGSPFYSIRNKIRQIEINTGVTTIGDAVFYSCGIVTDVSIPSSVVSIGKNSFRYCDSLINISIPEGVSSLGSYAFYICHNLASVTIPESMTSIGEEVFKYCDHLTSVYIYSENVEIGNNCFFDCADLTIFAPPGSTAQIYASNNSIPFIPINTGEGGSCGASVDWTITSDGYLYIYGTGVMTDYQQSGNVSPFSGNNAVLTATIQEGVTSVGNWAFRNCTNLQSISIPASVASIGLNAFSGCPNLTIYSVSGSAAESFAAEHSIPFEILPDATGTCGDNVVWNLYGDTLVISGTGPMQDYGFYNSAPYAERKSEISKVVIQTGVTCIGSYAFNWFSNLTDATIPDTVSAIHDHAFNDCDALVNIIIPESVKSIDNNAFGGCKSLADLSIPSGVTVIGNYAFYSCSGLTEVSIPSSVTTIGSFAFYNDNNLTRVTILNPACVIGDSYYDVFSGSSDLTLYGYSGSTTETYADVAGITFEAIPNGNCGDNVYWLLNASSGVMTISGTGAMADYSGTDMPWYDRRTEITSLVIEEGVTAIGGHAFYGCNRIGEVIIPDSVTTIKEYAFTFCDALQEINLSANVLSIESYAFAYNQALRRINVAADNAAYCSVDGVLFNHDQWLLICYPGGKPETSYTVPDSVTNMSYAAFAYNTALKSITLNSGLGEIPTTAFRSCTGLTSIVIPDHVQTIGLAAFYNCTSLTYVEIGSGVSGMRNNVFMNCSALQTVLFQGSAPAIGGNVFKNCTLTAYYPAGDATWTDDKKQDYGGTVTWIDNSCGDNVTWAFDPATGTLTISGTGPMADYSSVSSVPWYGCHTGITSVSIGSSVTAIGDVVFANCTGLTGVTIPDGVISIGGNAFANCTGLTGVTIPISVTSIDYNAFRGCTSLTSVTILNPSCVIGDSEHDVFKNCAASFVLHGWPGSTAETYASAAGHTFEALTADFILPAALTTIEEDAFQGISAVSVQIPASVTSISGNPFAGSGVVFIYGVPGTAAETFASAYGYTFVPVTD